MKKAIVTGAGGFIGGALTQLLLQNDYTVYGIDINEEALNRFATYSGFYPVCADLEDNNITARLPENVDVVFHLALKGTMGAQDRMNADLQIDNISAAVHFCQTVIGKCQHFIFCSSSYEFLRNKKDKRIPMCFYGSAKRAAADMCANIAYRNGKSFNKVIFTNTYGVGDRSNKTVNMLIRKMLTGESLSLIEGNDPNDWVYIDDTVNGLYAVLEKGTPFETYYIGHRKITTFREKIEAMRDTLCPDMTLSFGTMPEDSCVDYEAIDLNAIYRDTGFESQEDFKDSIIKTANWLNSSIPANSAGGYKLPSSYHACRRKGGGAMKKVIVTGAGGFIGGALTEHLLEKGVTVYGVDISEKALERHSGKEGFIPIAADFTKYNRLHEMIQDKNVDVFYHFAWQGVFGEPFKDYRLQLSNAVSAGDAITEAVKIGCKKFVFVGTMNEYEMDEYIKADYFEPRYTYIYSAAKQAAEAVCKTIAFNQKIQFNCGRIAMAYGENNRSMMIPNVVMKNLLTNTPCKLVEGLNLYDMIYIDDIVRAFYAIGEYGVNMKSYYVGHRNIGTFKEIIEQIADILNPDCPLLFGEYPDAPSGVDYKSIDTEALYRDTGFECQADFKESILKTVEWIRKNI